MKLLPLGLVTVALVAASVAGACRAGRSQVHSGLEMRSCGYLSVGKGWRVRATRNVKCVSARKLVRTFFDLPRCVPAQRRPGKACTVSGYRCVETALPDDVGLVRFARSGRVVSARSNH